MSSCVWLCDNIAVIHKRASFFLHILPSSISHYIVLEKLIIHIRIFFFFFSPLYSGGMFSSSKSLTGGKTITREAMEPALEKMKDHLVTKNVVLEIAEKLCESVASKLEGRVVETFTGQWMCVLNSYHMLQTMHCLCSRYFSTCVPIQPVHHAKKYLSLKAPHNRL